jgi:hypothetical protein
VNKFSSTHGVDTSPPGLQTEPQFTRGASTPVKQATPLPTTFATFYFTTGDHPTCAAEQVLRKHHFAARNGRAESGGAMVADEEPITIFAQEKWNCFKHGGHCRPGAPRRLTLPPLPPLAGREYANQLRRSMTGAEVTIELDLYRAMEAYCSAERVKRPPPSRVLLRNVLVG